VTVAAEAAADDRLEARAAGSLSGSVDVPGDKSMSHRALILGGLAEGETRIEGLLEGEDVLHTAAALSAFGVEVGRLGPGSWRVKGGEWSSPSEPVYCGNSGTGARLLMGAAAGFPITATFTGDSSLSGRPMARILDPLRTMGAEVKAAEGDRLPATISGGGLNGISLNNARASAQVKSAVLLAGLRAEGEVEVIEPSPSRDHTENMLRSFGCDVVKEGHSIRLGARRRLHAAPVAIPGDPSSAAFPLIAALVVPGSEVVVRSVMINPLRAGLFETLREMGADLSLDNRRLVGGEEVADISARHGALRNVEVPAGRAPSMIDEYPILAIAAAFASGRAVMRGLAELRVKESDRLAAIVSGLRACGVEVWEEGDSLVVDGQGGPPAGGATIDAGHDHRIAMSFLIFGLAAHAPVAIEGAATIATSFPGFASLMGSLGARIER
jgi:3-phosphoshikimate 1-carboxyvinyltransferase